MNGNRFADLPAENVLAALGRCLPDLVFIVDGEGCYRAVLGGSDRRHYHEATHLLGRRFHDVMPRELADRMLAEVKLALSTGHLHTIHYLLTAEDVEGYSTRPGPRTPQWFEARISPVTDMAPGESFVIASVHNISERVHSETTLKRLAYTDELTGLPNRRAFRRTARALLQTRRGEGKPMALALIDIDHFKRINDSYGHHAGDSALRDFAGALLGELRESDYVARMGGEEFAVLLPSCPLPDAIRLIERVRDAVKRRMFMFKQFEFALTFSAGVAAVDAEGTDGIESLMDNADRALYRAKQKGRDRVASASSRRQLSSP